MGGPHISIYLLHRISAPNLGRRYSNNATTGGENEDYNKARRVNTPESIILSNTTHICMFSCSRSENDYQIPGAHLHD